MTFDGDTYDPDRDEQRLSAQFTRVREIMEDGDWHTLPELSAKTNAPEASVSARLRDLRKPRFGGRVLERQYVRRGLWRYRLVVVKAGAA